MHFQFYNSRLENEPKLSVDGTVDNNSVHLSHWQGNRTPPELRADTSTEIALNFVASPNREEIAKGIDLVTNNHFDTDGVLSVWTVLNGEHSLELKELLVAAAEAGDFSEFRNENAVRASIVIQGSDQAGPDESGSPLARHLSGGRSVEEAECYDLILPHVERVLTKTDEFEMLWRSGWDQLALALESFARGSSTCEEFVDAKLSLIQLSPDAFSPSGFKPTRHSAPFTAISANARGHLFLIATPMDQGWFYRIDYPYYSWAQTVIRPQIERFDLQPILDHLNDLETASNGKWTVDNSEMTSAAKFLDADVKNAASKIAPDLVAQTIRDHVIHKQALASNKHA